jgi:hypothetical protein
VPLGQNRVRPSRTVWARPTATRGAARARGAGTTHVDGRAAGGTATDDVGGFGPRWSGWRLGRDDDARGEAAAVRARLRRALSGRVVRCLDSGLKARASSAARVSHVATARCRAGPARCAASDRWGPLVSNF